MARIRTIKPEFFTSESVSELPLRARLTWIGLWTHCDDYGRTRDNTKLIKAAIWALDQVTLLDVDADLTVLEERGRIVRYEVDGRNYLAVTAWDEHQKINRRGEPKFPAPPGTEDSLPTPVPLTESSVSTHGALTDDSLPEQGTGNREQGVGVKPTTRPRGRRIPDDFEVTNDMREWARTETPHVAVDQETKKFIDHWRAESGQRATKADWVSTWRNWMRKAQEWLPSAPKPHSAGPAGPWDPGAPPHQIADDPYQVAKWRREQIASHRAVAS